MTGVVGEEGGRSSGRDQSFRALRFKVLKFTLIVKVEGHIQWSRNTKCEASSIIEEPSTGARASAYKEQSRGPAVDGEKQLTSGREGAEMKMTVTSAWKVCLD